MNYLEILRQDVLEYLKDELKDGDDKHEQIYVYVFERMDELKKEILKRYNDIDKYSAQKDRKAVLDNFLDGFCSSDWKKYFFNKTKSKAELRKLKYNCLVKSSATENLLNGLNIVPKSKDFYSVYLDYDGWNHFMRKKSKNRKHKNNSKRVPKFITDYIPQIKQDEIVGRELDLEDLHQRLFGKKSVLLVNAIGGIGKTTLAAVYLTEFDSSYKHIVWINYSSTDDFKNNLINASGLLKRLNINKTDKTTDELFSEIITALDSISNTPCLMIIDNAEEELCDFVNLLPKQPNWHILITSREKIPFFEEIKELDFLNLDEAVELFKKNYERKDLDKKVIEKIVTDLDFHTLSIEILAKMAKDRDQSPESVLEFLKSDIVVDVRVRHSGNKIEKITSYLVQVFDKLGNLDDDKKWLMAQLSCLPPKQHSYKELKKFIEIDRNRKIDLRKNLKDLTSKGWILYNKKNESFRLHRIIIEVIHQMKSIPIDFDTIEPLFSYVTSQITLVFNSKNDPKYRNDNYYLKFSKWKPYGEILLNKFNGNEKIITKLQNIFPLLLKDLMGEENLQQAKQWLMKVIDSTEKNLGASHPNTAVGYSNLATVLGDMGGRENLLEAKKWLEKAIDSDIQGSRENHPVSVVRCSNLATILQDLGGRENLQQAKQLLIKVVSLTEENFGSKCVEIALRHSNLAMILKDLGGIENLGQAKQLMKKSINLYEENFGKEHPETAISYSNLAMILKDLGGIENLGQAKQWLEKAINSNEESFGEKHPNTALNYSNLATILLDLRGKENLKQAEQWLEKSINSDKDNFATNHPVMATRYSNLALVLQNIGGRENLLQAKLYLEKSISSAEENFGVSHSITVTRYSNLATVFEVLGGNENLEKAKELLVKVIGSDEKNFGVNHPNTAISYCNLAMVLKGLGGNENLEKAKLYLEKSISSDEENFGVNHPTIAQNYSNLALVFKDLKGKDNLQKAKLYLEKSISSDEENFGVNHPTTALRYFNLATVLFNISGIENLHRAKQLTERAYKITKETLGENDSTTITMKHSLENIKKYIIDAGF